MTRGRRPKRGDGDGLCHRGRGDYSCTYLYSRLVTMLARTMQTFYTLKVFLIIFNKSAMTFPMVRIIALTRSSSFPQPGGYTNIFPIMIHQGAVFSHTKPIQLLCSSSLCKSMIFSKIVMLCDHYIPSKQSHIERKQQYPQSHITKRNSALKVDGTWICFRPGVSGCQKGQMFPTVQSNLHVCSRSHDRLISSFN